MYFTQQAKTDKSAKRVVFFDTLRGFTLVSMIAFHLTYDLAYLYGIDLPWFTSSPFQDIWRATTSWTFLLLAGWMTQHSRNNLKRGFIYAAAALLVFMATTIARVDTPISFGILYCMAFCTITYEAASHLLKRFNPFIMIIICMGLFVLTYNVPSNTYPFSGLSWLGLPAQGFASSDYYPPIPYFFLYGIGVNLAILYLKNNTGTSAYPSWMHRDFCPPLTAMGRHSLVIYLAHQPIILAAINLAFG